MRLATFNLKHGAPADGYKGDPRKVAEACASLKADILALQEVDKGAPRSRFADLAQLAARASEMEMVFLPTRERFGMSYGNALLVRGQIKNVEELALGGTKRFHQHIGGRELRWGFERRNAVLAAVLIDQQPFSVAATHLSTDKCVSARQLSHITAALAEKPGARVLMGDLNRNRREVDDYTSVFHMDLAVAPPTFPSVSPKRSIDHIAVSGLEICGVEARQMQCSDHRALIIDVEIQ